MFKVANLKLYRKALILALMLGCLSFISYGKQVALPCCDSCDPAYDLCENNCYLYVKPENWPACLAVCENHYNNCVGHCTMCP